MSPWYYDIVYVLRNVQASAVLKKIRARSIKLKSTKICILNEHMYWKDPGSILLNFLLEDEARQTIEEFHKGYCGGHHSWKVTVNKILRAGFYWPSLFSDVYKEIAKCHHF